MPGWLRRLIKRKAATGSHHNSCLKAAASSPAHLTPESERIPRLVEQIKQKKREGHLAEAESLLLEECDRQEEEFRKSGSIVAPWYYWQLAVIYRKLKEPQKELAILERFERFDSPRALGARYPALRERLRKIRSKSAK